MAIRPVTLEEKRVGKLWNLRFTESVYVCSKHFVTEELNIQMSKATMYL